MTTAAPVVDPVVTGMRCAVCGTRMGIGAPLTWKCPGAVSGEPHLLRFERGVAPLRAGDDPNPFVAFRPYLAWDAFAAAAGLSVEQRVQVIRSLDASIAAVDGTGFRWTPFARSDGLSDALGFSDRGGVWVKDDTGNVAGSHKARHLMTIALHLLVAEQQGLVPWHSVGERPHLAIASCGNAAIAASTIAAAMGWPISVFVPQWSEESVVQRLDSLRATVVRCPRRDTDPPGDPCVLRFREAVASGSIPFAVQGPENAWCHDGGRTIGWELALQFEAAQVHREQPGALDRLFVQVGGGALASGAWSGAADRANIPRLHAVQTQGCAPLARAWHRARALPGGVGSAGAHWRECMWPWEDEPVSTADGILDDETYDWLPIVEAMSSSNGYPVVAPEMLVREAHRLGCASTGIRATPTATAGLAGLLTVRNDVHADENVVVLFTGVVR
ncbi:MAG: pyridoxal-phosphate dependent enzyme [Actinobacteria bacterium]|uniref:L-serine ammonia-lyase n=1 Tax=freshwater metagenome TaxID=449393 RepID=A0A6J7DEY6_9ZZZZ|nr:pyridoxal-phosphate dependent enzyme [Actinomycetota bacterium]MSY12261.1 pyridoxal-phosphate dependent enzyme [Actinomycetota bacterium]MSZ04317.1 pyridoxal-phosphate dependent enzyme [Actinomycetota bacterium]